MANRSQNPSSYIVVSKYYHKEERFDDGKMFTFHSGKTSTTSLVCPNYTNIFPNIDGPCNPWIYVANTSIIYRFSYLSQVSDQDGTRGLADDSHS